MDERLRTERLQKTWDTLGRENPMWAVASNRSEWSVDDFYASGEEEIAEMFAHLEGAGIDVPRGSALDFGSGLGRLSRALGSRFDAVTGVDISPSMVKQARELNAEHPNLTFLENSEPDLSLFGSGEFDFVLSRIVLQHMEPSLAESYIREFIRTAKPGGVVLFQVPSARIEAGAESSRLQRVREMGLRSAAAHLRGRLTGTGMEMHCVPRARVEEIVAGAGGSVLDVTPDDAAGETFESYTYAVSPSAG